jgi:hypothetical protein
MEVSMGTASKAVLRVLAQNAFGVSDPAPNGTWGKLSVAMGWDVLKPSPEQLAVARDNARRYLADLTKLLEISFAKIGSVIVALALIFAFGSENLKSGRQISAAAALLAVLVALAAVIWALAPRFKVWRRSRDIGLIALNVLTVEDEIVDAYTWLWQRYRTWRNIERMFNLVCVLAVISIGVMAWNIVPWDSLHLNYIFH